MDAAPFESPSVEAPFVVLQGVVEGAARPLRVLFDTGDATPYAVVVGRRSPAAALAVPTGEPPLVIRGTAGGRPAVFTPATLPTFRLGPIALTNASAGVSPAIDLVSGQLPGGLDAVVGQAFAAQRIVRIDYPARRIDFAASPGPAADALPMTLAPKRPLSLVEGRINGRGPFWLVVDTAAFSTLISPQVAKQAGVGRRGTELILRGAGGRSSTGRAEIASVTVGRRHWAATRVVVTDILGPVAEESGAKVDGVIGADLLGQGVLTLDYPGRRIWIEPPGP